MDILKLADRLLVVASEGGLCLDEQIAALEIARIVAAANGENVSPRKYQSSLEQTA